VVAARRLADVAVTETPEMPQSEGPADPFATDDSARSSGFTTTFLETPAREQARRRLEAVLEREGTGFEFVQVMRLLHRMHPHRDPVGGWTDPRGEVARMYVTPTLAFPPSEISGVEITAAEPRRKRNVGDPARIGVRFFGLTGPQGVLPHGYTEYAAARARAKDTGLRDFLDLFHHRLLSLFYRAWERHHTAVAKERGDEDRIHAHLLDLIGAGNPIGQRKSVLPSDTLAFYAGLLSMRSRPALGLSQLVSDYFGVTATVEQFVGEWRALPDGGQVCLGDDDADGRLGQAVIGSAVYDPHSRVMLRLGPLSRAQFDTFLPQGRHYKALKSLAQFYADDEVGVDAQLVLARDEVPSASLGTTASPRLGFGTWLRNRTPVRDPDDVLLRLC
jgi:type VI secretion system protein ImpH